MTAPPAGRQQTSEALTLHVEGLCFAYPSRPLFAQWHARFAPGLHVVCGDDGCGKTSLLRLLAADLAPQAGRLQMGRHSPTDDLQGYQRQVFRTDPTAQTFDAMTPVQWFDSLRSRHPTFDMAQAQVLLQSLFLQEHLHKTGHMLSTGSRRKVWLVAALASGAALLLIDQPFAALDAPSIRAVTELLQESGDAAQQVTVLADYEAPAGLRLTQTLQLG
jgi:ABC-type multidrug transport system ATPase subunit